MAFAPDRTVSAGVLDPGARAKLEAWRAAREKIVFTNGVFDLLHRGHAEYLEEARSLGDRLVVGINSDASVRRLKGAQRPIVPEPERAELVGSLASVDLTVIFEDDTPLALITEVQPDILVKGADWAADEIVGRDVVEARGGRVVRVAMREGISTSLLVKRILEGRSAFDPWE
ncbi:MAG: D-glycero-beta-D-manno-heptose 1-phosphate adenylyltransferase [Candidatus Eisenbacteria bacterium]|nr:D-glycero-beta-D-manno-heptose 1-phosphate adenylyltransferase [Candidatus Eisenbacteria bacterium]